MYFDEFFRTDGVWQSADLSPILCVLTRSLGLLVGANGELSYVIAHGNDEGLFAVDQLTGAVTVAGSLDAVYGRSFRLVVTVKDHGNPERLAVADLTVAVNATSPAVAAVARRGTLHCLLFILYTCSSSSILTHYTVLVVHSFVDHGYIVAKRCEIGPRLVTNRKSHTPIQIDWWHGVVGNASRMRRSYSTPCPVST